MVRIDSTVTAALMHGPSDSALLWDAGAPDDAAAAPGGGVAGSAGNAWHDRRRMAKRCASEIAYSRGKDSGGGSIAS